MGVGGGGVEVRAEREEDEKDMGDRGNREE